MRLSLIKTFFVLLALMAISVGVAAEEKSPIEFDWYGYFKLDGAYDQNPTSHGNFVMWLPQSAYEDDEQFNMTANETRFGINVNAGQEDNLYVAGKIEFDLYASVGGGTVAENKAMLQLRHAYFEVKSSDFKLLAGQSWDLISPLNPSTLNYPVLWGCGNVGYRRPQVSVWYYPQVGDNADLTLATGFFRTIGSDLTPTFSLATDETTDGPDDGTDAGIPSVQGLLDFKYSLNSGGFVRTGVSALWGELKAETNLGNYEKYENWGVFGHLMVAFTPSVGVSGEYYSGTNIGNYFGGILHGSTIEGVNSAGGWTSAWVKPHPKVKLTAGYGFDDPKDEDISSGRSKNECIFGNVRYNLVSNVMLGLEVAQWKTDYLDSETAENLRVQTSFIFSY